MNTFTAAQSGGMITLAPSLPGDVVELYLSNQSIFVQSGSYLASSNRIAVDTSWGGAKTFFAREGLILLKISGSGNVILSSYGAIHEVTLAAGEKYVVDTGHLVSFNSTLNFVVRKVAGWKSTIFGGEGLVVELTGPGKLTLQTREGARMHLLIGSYQNYQNNPIIDNKRITQLAFTNYQKHGSL